MTSLPALYADRSRFEIRTMLRDRRTVVFTMLLPIFMLVIFGSVFKSQTIGRTGTTFTQYLVAGLLASGILYSAFQQMAIAVPEERSDGTLKRLVGSPMPPSVYFVGKLAVALFTYVFQVIVLLVLGQMFFHIHVPHRAAQWLVFGWVSVLGLVGSSLLGIAFSNLAKDGRAASALAAPLVLFFQFTSGVYFVYTSLPKWMQIVAAVFPLKWMAQAMRGVFLPAAFGAHEAGGSFQYGAAALVLGGWTVVATLLCLFSFRWLPREKS